MIMLALLAGCGSTPSGSFVTYNAGLAVGFVPGSVERQNSVAQAIAGIDADVICVQEVWLDEQVTAVTSAASNTFPNTYFPAKQPEVLPEPACPDGQLDTLLQCATDNCEGVCQDDLLNCIFDNCQFPFALLPQECMRCTMANVGGTIDDVVEACTTQTVGFAYGGSFGTGLLSRHPLRNVEEKVFESTTNRRAAIHAVVEMPKGDVDVYCTHLTASFDTIPYPRPEGSWSEEQTTQIEELRAWIDETAVNPVVALGDFNVGPSGDGLVAEEAANYGLLSDGYDVPFLDLVGDCTFCGSNPLVALGGDDQTSELIDHVLVKGWDEPTYAAERVLDGDLEHPVCGTDITGAYSDHYGVRVSINEND